jgi:hypothetical protein
VQTAVYSLSTVPVQTAVYSLSLISNSVPTKEHWLTTLTLNILCLSNLGKT